MPRPDQLSLRGAGTDYNILSRFFATKAQADAALQIVAGFQPQVKPTAALQATKV